MSQWEKGVSPSPIGARRHGLRVTGARASERPRRKRGPGAERGLRGQGTGCIPHSLNYSSITATSTLSATYASTIPATAH